MRTKPYRPGATESQVMAQVVEAAAAFGIALERRNTGAMLNPAGKMVRFGIPGDSDLVGIVPAGPNRGRTVAVEVKREGFKPPRRGRPREHFERQLARLKSVNDKGGLAFWVSSGVDALRVFRYIADTPNISIVFPSDYPLLELDGIDGVDHA